MSEEIKEKEFWTKASIKHMRESLGK